MTVYGHATGDGVGSISAAVMEWIETDDRFDGVAAQDVITILRDELQGAASLTVAGPRKGDIEFGRRANLTNPFLGQKHAYLDLTEVIARARAMHDERIKR